MCNRDEKTTRAPALPPVISRFGRRLGIAPRDPDGGGSWIGVNDRGLVVVLLNRPAGGGEPARALTSRGQIVTRLLASDDLAASALVASQLSVKRFAPFTLLAMQHARAFIADGRTIRVTPRPFDISRPRLLTSSSFQPRCATAFRRALFRSIVYRSDSLLTAQRAFHDNRHAERPDISVLMTRDDARTVSRTTVDLRPSHVTLTYEPLEPGARAVSCDLRL